MAIGKIFAHMRNLDWQERVMIDYVNAPKPTSAPWWMVHSCEIKFWSLIAAMILVGGLA